MEYYFKINNAREFYSHSHEAFELLESLCGLFKAGYA